MIIVLSDGVSEAWRSGEAVAVLADWGRRATSCWPRLPEYLWTRTAIGTAVPVMLRAPGPLAPSSTLEIEWPDAFLFRSLPAPLLRAAERLPVVSLDREALEWWSRAVAGASGVSVPGLAWPGSARAKPSAIPPTVTPPAGLSPEALVRRFWKVASPTARTLARLLAAAPVITLPIIRLIRETMLARTAWQVHEAEVLLSGLLERAARPSPTTRNSSATSSAPGCAAGSCRPSRPLMPARCSAASPTRSVSTSTSARIATFGSLSTTRLATRA